MKKNYNKKQESQFLDEICDCDDIDEQSHCKHLTRMCPFPFCTHRTNKHAKLGLITRKNIRSQFNHFDNDAGIDGEPGHRYTASASGILRRINGWNNKTNKGFILGCGIEFWNDDEWIYLDPFRQRMRIEFRNNDRSAKIPLPELKWISTIIDRDNNGIITNMNEIIETIQKYKVLV